MEEDDEEKMIMARRKTRKNSIPRAALDVGLGGATFGITTDIVGRVPHGQAGASALATGASFLPVYSVARVGRVITGKMERIARKRRRWW